MCPISALLQPIGAVAAFMGLPFSFAEVCAKKKVCRWVGSVQPSPERCDFKWIQNLMILSSMICDPQRSLILAKVSCAFISTKIH